MNYRKDQFQRFYLSSKKNTKYQYIIGELILNTMYVFTLGKNLNLEYCLLESPSKIPFNCLYIKFNYILLQYFCHHYNS